MKINQIIALLGLICLTSCTSMEYTEAKHDFGKNQLVLIEKTSSAIIDKHSSPLIVNFMPGAPPPTNMLAAVLESPIKEDYFFSIKIPDRFTCKEINQLFGGGVQVTLSSEVEDPSFPSSEMISFLWLKESNARNFIEKTKSMISECFSGEGKVKHHYSQNQDCGYWVHKLVSSFTVSKHSECGEKEVFLQVQEIRVIKSKTGLAVTGYTTRYPVKNSQLRKEEINRKKVDFFDSCKVIRRTEIPSVAVDLSKELVEEEQGKFHK